MKKCLIYGRKSTSSQEEKSHNLKDQITGLKKYAKKLGYKVVNVFQEYKSGSKAAFSNLLEAVKQGEVKVIVCQDISRLARSYCDWKDIEKMFEEKGVKVVTP